MASGLLAVIGPITTAARLEKKLGQTTGMTIRIVHTPEEIAGGGGCSYSLRTKAENMPVVMETAAKYKIRVKAYYITEINDGKEVYHAIS